MNLSGVRMLEFPQHGDDRGHLVVVEGMKDIPFEIITNSYLYINEDAMAQYSLTLPAELTDRAISVTAE